MVFLDIVKERKLRRAGTERGFGMPVPTLTITDAKVTNRERVSVGEGEKKVDWLS